MDQYVSVTPEEALLARDGTIKLHGTDGFAGMRAAGKLASEIFDALVPHVVPGVTTQELDDIVRSYDGCWRRRSGDAGLSRLYA